MNRGDKNRHRKARLNMRIAVEAPAEPERYPAIRSNCYKLEDDGTVTPCRSVIEWGLWFESANRTIAFTQIGLRAVSTVFLGVDHSFGGGPPVLFETMVFRSCSTSEEDTDPDFARGPEEDQRRYTSLEDAKTGHAEIVKELQALFDKRAN